MNETVLLIIVAVAIVDLSILSSAWRKGTAPQFGQRPPNWDSTDEATYWALEAEKARREQLVKAREVAKNWGQSIAGLLGVLGTAAFLKGPESLDKVPGDNAYAVASLIGVAGLAAAIAVYLAAIAAQGTPAQIENFDGWRMKQLTELQAPQVTEKLRRSRGFALVAAVTLLAAMLAAWAASLSARGGDAKGQAFVLIDRQGESSCGTLSRTEDGQLVLKRDETETTVTDAAQLVAVDDCPK